MATDDGREVFPDRLSSWGKFIFMSDRGTALLMREIQLLDLDNDALMMIEADLDLYCARHNARAGANAVHIRDTVALWRKFMLSVRAVPPWIGYLTVDESSRTIIGTCAFKGNPNQEGTVEIAYFTFPDHEGKGYATAMAHALIQIALTSPEVPGIIAHTLPQANASTKVLQKVGMKFVGDVIDPEDGPVWRWQYERAK
jgi:RimJ/RimL family protein N-acetyltransferase